MLRTGKTPRFAALAFALAVSPSAPQGSDHEQASTARAGPDNLLINASFEDLGADGQPVGWRPRTWGGSAEFDVDDAVARTGARSVRITSTEGADASWGIEVPVRPRTRYRLTAWVRTRGLEVGSGQGALCNLHELDMSTRTGAVAGDADWTQVATEFDSGERRTLLVNMLFGGWGRSTGAAWWDDVELIDLTAPLPVLGADEQRAFFREQVHPILEQNCWKCHGPDSELKGDFFLGSREGLLAGGVAGPAVAFDDPLSSLLVRALHYDVLEMPPSGKLGSAEIDVLTNWVRLGAPYDPELEAARPAVAVHRTEAPDMAAGRAHWAFQPVERPPVPGIGAPEVADPAWGQNPIDAFVADALADRGLTPSGEAPREVLVRRAYHVLLGLPPRPAQVRAFVDDDRPDAFEVLVDELLASPHYGERMARQWLDVVRYAETNSFERDSIKPFVWRYRDWVIGAFNDDLPYDRFVLEQLAGDELPDADADSMIATGFYRLGQWDDEPANPELAMYDELDDIVATTSQAFLGLTMNCARCHDHKLDPIPQDDYYRMLAYFRNVRRYGQRSGGSVEDASVAVIASEDERVRHAEAVAAHGAAVAAVDAKLDAIADAAKPRFVPVDLEEFEHENRRVATIRKYVEPEVADEYEALFRQRRELRARPPAGLAQALVVKESGPTAPDTFVLIRGLPGVHGRFVQPGVPVVLGMRDPEIARPAGGQTTGRRLALARWIADPSNPLTARVMVNRVWQHHFGEGLVGSPNNFGLKGEAPTHPELLDWLAAEFVARGFSVKAMHRLILTSRTWRQAFRRDPVAEEVDPTNALLWRAEPRRLSAEEVRDTMLAVSGELDLRTYGPSVFPVIAKEVLAGQSRPGDGWHLSAPEDRDRRTIYVHVKRSLILPIVAVFDGPDTDTSCPERFLTTQPTQALTMLNSDLAGGQAAALARDVARAKPGDLRAQVELALWRGMQRRPRDGEIERGVAFVDALVRDEEFAPDAALARFCLVVLNLDEFMYVR